MTETEILHEICKEIRLLRKQSAKDIAALREELTAHTKTTMTTKEVCDFLKIRHPWPLTLLHRQGLLQRYGSSHAGYKYQRSHIQSLQVKLLSGEIQMPKQQ